MYRRHIRARFRLYLSRTRLFLIRKVLHADDPPHRLALGTAIGVFVTFTPTVGFQMLIVIFLAWLLRANKLAGIPVVWISNPATMVPMYYSCYLVGRLLLGWEPVGDQWWLELRTPPIGLPQMVAFYWSRFWQIAAPLWIGCIVLGLLAAYAIYYLSYHLICAYRMRRWGQLNPPPVLPPAPLKRRDGRRVRQETAKERQRPTARQDSEMDS